MKRVNCQCSPIGTNNQTGSTAVRDHRLYLNTASPAPCSGTIKRWRFCFHRPVTQVGSDRYRVTWAVYRRVGSGNSTHYEIVRSSQRTTTRNDPSSGNFWCRNENPPDFNIEAGDIVGACIYEPRERNREQMDIVSEADGYSLMEMMVTNQCGKNLIPSTILSSQLSRVNSRILHLYAMIESMYIVHNFTVMCAYSYVDFALTKQLYIYICRSHIHSHHPSSYTCNVHN